MKASSNLGKFAAQLDASLDRATRQTAEKIAERAKTRVPVKTRRLHDAIHVEKRGEAEYEVVAGDETAFYGHIVEHGGAHTPARPFLTPAIEESRDDLPKLADASMRSLL